MNGSLISLFFGYTTKVLLNKINLVARASELSYGSNFSNLLNKAYALQKRMSQYFTSFIFGGSSYSIAGFFELNKQENIIMMIIGLIVCLSLPLTKYEWFNSGNILIN
jgi:hypothetical protein